MRSEVIATLPKLGSPKKAIQVVKMWTDARAGEDGVMEEHELFGFVEVSFYTAKDGTQKIYPVRAVYFPAGMKEEIKSYL